MFHFKLNSHINLNLFCFQKDLIRLAGLLLGRVARWSAAGSRGSLVCCWVSVDGPRVHISFVVFHLSTMSFSYVLIADSNVQRFHSLVNRRACPDLDQASVIICGKLAVFRESLATLPPRSNSCVIVACITNFLTGTIGDELSASVRIEPLLLELRGLLHDLCSAHDFVLVCPPMYRSLPLWYRDNLASIMNKCSSVLTSGGRPGNLLFLPSFSTPTFDQDGIHLTPASGLEYIFHLFDSAKLAISRSTLDVPELVSTGDESTRVLEDRVMALEQDHRRLNSSFEMSQAIIAEKDDFQENVRNESFFMVTGLPPIRDLRGKEWMARAITDVQGMIQTLLGKELKVLVVHNATGRAPESEVRYSVQMESAAASQEIRTKFGSFFVGRQDRRPEALRQISVSNKITPGTQVRIMILKLLSKRYLASNPDAKVRVVGYEPRPILKITPPESSSDHRVMVYTYIEAISRLPTCFTVSELRPIIAKARVHFRNRLRSTFVVLSDDAPVASRSDNVAAEVSSLVSTEVESNSVSVPASSNPASRKRGSAAVAESESQRPRI